MFKKAYAVTLMISFLIPLLAHSELVSEDSDIEYPINFQKMGLYVPTTDDPKMNDILRSKDTIYYKLPQVYQQFTPGMVIEERNLTLNTTSSKSVKAIIGLYRADYLSDFNANADFPWETTIGLNMAHKRKDNPYSTFNFVHRPDGRPILIINERPIKWIFPPQTTVGELIYVKNAGVNYVQEIRTRTKSLDNTKWFPAVYRPVKDQEELCRLTGIKTYNAAKKYFFFRNPEEDEVSKVEGYVDRIPDLTPEQVKFLLTRNVFKKTDWNPCSDIDFNIVPKDYSFGALGKPDSQVCAECHKQTQISVRNLIPREPTIIKNPTKVGNIRGSDAVFTWHPFHMTYVRKSDKDADNGWALRPYDINNRTVVLVNKNDPVPSDYRITEFVQEALKDYELPEQRFLHERKSAKKD